MTQIIAQLADLGRRYDAVFCDLWGCLHNGKVPFPQAVSALQGFRANGGTWPILTDDDGSIGVAFGVAKVPETWIIDADGFVRLRLIQAVTDDQLTRLLAEARASS